MRKNLSFYGKSLPRPSLVADPDLPVLDVVKDQRGRVGFVPVTQPLMGAQTSCPLPRGTPLPAVPTAYASYSCSSCKMAEKQRLLHT